MYLIKEIQTTDGVTVELPVVMKQTRLEAESEYHIKAGYAAISNVPIHTVMCFTEDGFQVMPPVCYRHMVPVVEPEESEETPEQ